MKMPQTTRHHLPKRHRDENPVRIQSWFVKHALQLLFSGFIFLLAACGGGGGTTTAGTAGETTTTVSGTTTTTIPVVEDGNNAGSYGAIAYGNKVYVSIYQNSFSTSPDGRNWSAPVAGVNWKFSQVIWDRAQFVAIGAGGMTATSKDGVQWTLRKANTDYDLLYVQRVNDVLIATGMPTDLAVPKPRSVTLTSSDGVTWSAQTANIIAREFVLGAGRLVALDTYTASAGSVCYSLNGVDWTLGVLPPISDAPAETVSRSITKLAYGHGQFVAIVEFRSQLAGMTGYALWSSADGAEWQARYSALSINPQSRLNAVAYAGNQFVAVGSDGIILTSADGLSWIKRDSGTNKHLYTVTLARDLLIAAGETGTILTSPDGITWKSIATDVPNGLFEVRYAGAAFYALMSGEANYRLSLSYYSANYGHNPYRTTANLISLDGTRWLGGPAQAGSRFDGQIDAVTTATPAPAAFLGEPATLPDEGPIAADASGNLYVGDQIRGIIIKVPPNGPAVLFAGRSGIRGVRDGKQDEAEFTNPANLTTDAAGNVFVDDGLYTSAPPMNLFVPRAAIRKITPDGTVTTIAGSATEGNESDIGSADGIGTNARFECVNGLTVDGTGMLFASDGCAATIRSIDAAGVVTTLAGKADSLGYLDGVGSAARFSSPRWIQSDAGGNLYVASNVPVPSPSVIRKITPDGVVSTFAELPPKAQAMTMDRATGTLYIADDATIYKLTPAGVSTATGISVSGTSALAFMAPNKLAIFANRAIRIVPLAN